MIVANDETLKVKAIENLRKLWIDINQIDRYINTHKQTDTDRHN